MHSRLRPEHLKSLGCCPSAQSRLNLLSASDKNPIMIIYIKIISCIVECEGKNNGFVIYKDDCSKIECLGEGKFGEAEG